MTFSLKKLEKLIQTSSLIPRQADKDKWIKKILPKLSPLKQQQVWNILLNMKKHEAQKLKLYKEINQKITEVYQLFKKFIIQNKEKSSQKQTNKKLADIEKNLNKIYS